MIPILSSLNNLWSKHSWLKSQFCWFLLSRRLLTFEGLVFKNDWIITNINIDGYETQPHRPGLCLADKTTWLHQTRTSVYWVDSLWSTPTSILLGLSRSLHSIPSHFSYVLSESICFQSIDHLKTKLCAIWTSRVFLQTHQSDWAGNRTRSEPPHQLWNSPGCVGVTTTTVNYKMWSDGSLYDYPLPHTVT